MSTVAWALFGGVDSTAAQLRQWQMPRRSVHVERNSSCFCFLIFLLCEMSSLYYSKLVQKRGFFSLLFPMSVRSLPNKQIGIYRVLKTNYFLYPSQFFLDIWKMKRQTFWWCLERVFFGLDWFWSQPQWPNFPSPLTTISALRLDCSTGSLATLQEVLCNWKLVELKMSDFSDRTRTGISILTSAAYPKEYIGWNAKLLTI